MSKLKRLTALILTLAMLLSSLPAALAVDVDADAAAEEAAVVAAETSAEEAAVVAAEASVEEAAAVEEETSVEEAAAVEEGTSAEEAAAVEAKASVEEGAVVEEEPSAEEETSGAEVAAVSEETTTNLDFQVYVNPLYEDVIDADDIDLEAMEANLEAALCSEDGADYLSHDEAVKVIRNYLANRTTSFTVYYYSSSAPDEYYSLDLVDDAMAHTGLSNQGDAILWDWSVCGCSQSWSTPSGNSAYYITLVYNVQYYTTTAQESWLKSKITSIVNSLGLEGKNDYEKIKAIYDYICENVDYDYDHLNDSSYTLQYTAYAALHDGASVCQGYAVLFYRMALEAGIDARVIAGETDGGSHGWNIVQLGSYYYNLDSTWDAGSYVYSYFLKCSDSFDSSHIRWSTYTTSAFQSEYPIADCDYGDGETLPDTPVLESISNVSNGVKITWSAVDGATSYYVYRKVSGSSSWSKVGPSTTTSYTSTGVTSGITYTFMVKAVNSFGVSGYDTTGKTICYLSVPAVTLSNVTGGVTITWTESAGATGGYYVYRRTESRSYTQIAKVASGTLTYTDKAASAGVRYYYMVRAYSNGYYSAYASQYITRLGTPTGIAVS
ncbi:MAG: hypothetical protein LUC30_00750, partial [Clostridiales bacterium]|nr:hypothetical protein [Clostridiales bacterium]